MKRCAKILTAAAIAAALVLGTGFLASCRYETHIEEPSEGGES